MNDDRENFLEIFGTAEQLGKQALWEEDAEARLLKKCIEISKYTKISKAVCPELYANGYCDDCFVKEICPSPKKDWTE